MKNKFFNWFLRTRLWHFILVKLVKNSQYEVAVPKNYKDYRK